MRGDIFASGEGGPQVAQKVSVTFACDYDEKEIPDGEHMTRAFSLDGRDYEIDLCEKHSQKFDEAVKRFADKARKVSTRMSRPKRRTAAHRQRSADIRAWAKRSGIDVSDRGRIPAQVITKYDASHR
jgi:Lsr2